MKASALAPGTLIGDRYRLLELIGAGGMGVVYRAQQLNLEREVALKILMPSDTESPADMLRRFAREARVASAIKHPNVVEIYDVGDFEGLTYMAMELLHGASLREYLEQLQQDEETLELDLVLDLATPLAEALVAAHAVGAVHRDLKPENIFLEQVGPTTRVVVLDFGLAFIEADETLGRMTRHGVIMGTPDYLSPEQARGGAVGPASDVYSLGCVLYELLSGKPPFSGSQLNVLTQHLYVTPDPPKIGDLKLPRELIELIMAMLRKRPEERPRIAEVMEQLELLASTLAGRRKRGDAKLLRSRAERMLSFSPTAPLPSSRPPMQAANADVRVAMVGEVSEEIELGLLSNDMALIPWRGQTQTDAGPIHIIFAAKASPEQVAALVATGLPVVAALHGDDRQGMGALARAGASEVTTFPLAIDNLVRALRRAKKRHDRRHRPSKS